MSHPLWNEISSDILELLEKAWKTLLRLFPSIVIGMIVSTIRLLIEDARLTWSQRLASWIVGTVCAPLAGLLTDSNWIVGLAALTGKEVLQYIMILFNKSNISRTLKKANVLDWLPKDKK